jgi:uncharacterized protein (TIRG00374 family)
VSTAATPNGVRRPPLWLLPALWAVLTIALFFAIRALPWRRALDQARHIQPVWLAAAVIANLIPLPIWALEWRLLAPGTLRIAYARTFEVVSVMAAVLNSVPLFAGEASGVAMLIGRAGLSRGAALSVLAMDQLLGGLVKIVVLAAAAILVPLPVWLRAGIFVLLLGVAAMLAVFVPLAHRWDAIRARMLQRPSKLRGVIAHLASWGEHLDAIRETHRVWKVSLLALAKKSVELLGILAVQMAFGLEPSLVAAVLVLAALAIATMMPVAPANVGVYEAMVFAAYRYVGVPVETALGLAVVQHLCFLLPMLATGYLTLTLRQLLPRRPSGS